MRAVQQGWEQPDAYLELLARGVSADLVQTLANWFFSYALPDFNGEENGIIRRCQNARKSPRVAPNVHCVKNMK